MSTLGERLLQLIESEEDNLNKFAIKHKIAHSVLHAVVSGKKNLGNNLMQKIITAIPNTNLNWLVSEIGDMKLSPKGDINNYPLLHDSEVDSDHDDPVEVMFLKYLDRKSVREKLNKIIKQEINQK